MGCLFYPFFGEGTLFLERWSHSQAQAEVALQTSSGVIKGEGGGGWVVSWCRHHAPVALDSGTLANVGRIAGHRRMSHVQVADEHRGANTLFLVSPDYKTVVAKPVGVSHCGAASCFLYSVLSALELVLRACDSQQLTQGNPRSLVPCSRWSHQPHLPSSPGSPLICRR